MEENKMVLNKSENTRKQHYVPCFYLKQFTNTDNKFFAYDFNNREMISSPVSYKSMCYKEYFYGEDGLLESKLRKMEGKWAPDIRKVIEQKILTDDVIASLKEFTLFQRQRTSDQYNCSTEERESVLLESYRLLCLHRGFQFDEKVIEFCKQRAREEVTPAENVGMAIRAVSLIDDLQVLIIHFHTDKKLITSDSPVIALNAFTDYQGHGYGNVGIIFLLPLSPEHLLVVYDAQLYKTHKGILYIESENEDDVECVNRYEIIHAVRWVFSRFSKEFDIISNELYEKREQEIKTHKPQVLGDEREKMIVTSIPGTGYYYDLSFICLPREWNRIPFQCREAIPRQFEDGWGRKLKMKYTIQCLANRNGRQKFILSKKELKLGCRWMENVAKIYWQDTMNNGI